MSLSAAARKWLSVDYMGGLFKEFGDNHSAGLNFECQGWVWWVASGCLAKLSVKTDADLREAD